MKIRNIKINHKKLIKLAALSASLVLATTTLSSCGREKGLFDGTILENTKVVTTTDGHKDIITIKRILNENVYESIIDGSVLAVTQYVFGKNEDEIIYCDIINLERISNYLIEEDLKKAYNNDLTDEDIINIISRIIGTSDKTKTLE